MSNKLWIAASYWGNHAAKPYWNTNGHDSVGIMIFQTSDGKVWNKDDEEFQTFDHVDQPEYWIGATPIANYLWEYWAAYVTFPALTAGEYFVVWVPWTDNAQYLQTMSDGVLHELEVYWDGTNVYNADAYRVARDIGMTLDEIKGVGWTGETLIAIKSVIDNILVDTETTLPAEINAVYSDVMGATVEGTYTVQEVLRIMAGALAGKLSGGGTPTLTFRDLSDTLDRITATVDTSGNRTAVTIDES